MLKLKNAQSLSRTDMKKLVGGTNDNSSRIVCDDECNYDAGGGACDDGKECLPRNCPRQPHIINYKCV